MKKLLLILFSVLSSGCTTAQTNLSELLKEANRVVINAIKIEVAKLKPAPADAVRNNALNTPDTIAGFPVDGDLKSLPRERAITFAKDILDPKHYADILQRCANTSLIGIRFSSGDEIIEFAYSQPCMQAFWAMKINGVIQFESAVLGPEYGKSILNSL